MTWWYLLMVFFFANMVVAGIREACNEKESRGSRIAGHLVAAIFLVILAFVSKALW